MKSFFKSLPFRLLCALSIGTILGLFFGERVMAVIVSVKNILNQIIMFLVPLIIIGFIAPSITKLGGSASKLLIIALLLAYGSSVLASLFSMGAGYFIIPHLSITTDATVKALPADVFALEIPPVMSVMSALVLSLMLGLSATWTKSGTMIKLLDEFQVMVLKLVDKIIIPILPVHILLTFSCLSYNGTITKQFPAFIKIILIVVVLQCIWLFVLYAVAGIYSGKSPLEVLRHYGPVYLTAIGTMSSAASLSVALSAAHKSKVLRGDMVDFGIPLFANIHLCGSCVTEVFFVMAISLMLKGKIPSVGTMVLFCVLLAVFALGAPGVPGGTAMASLGIVVSILGFDSTGTALVLAIYALQDSFGTACNITGDGALTMILSAYKDKHDTEQAGEAA